MADTIENKESMIPVINDHQQVVTQPVDKEPAVVEGQDARWKDHPPRLSKNMKLSMRHLGFKENAIEVSEEWKWENGEAVPPVGRDTSASYTTTEDKKYSSYGSVEYVEAVPFKDDPAGEVLETLKVTAGTEVTNDDKAFVDAVPVMAINLDQKLNMQLEGRHGEVSYDPITEENYLTRPGMEVKTSETYLATQEESENDEAGGEESVEPTAENGEDVPRSTVNNNVTETTKTLAKTKTSAKTKASSKTETVTEDK